MEVKTSNPNSNENGWNESVEGIVDRHSADDVTSDISLYTSATVFYLFEYPKENTQR
jgi:hypothetical protein